MKNQVVFTIVILMFLAGCSTSVIDRANDAATAKADAATARCIINPETCLK